MASAMNKKPDISTLNQYAIDAEAADKHVLAEMRSNLLLIAGDHYTRLNDKFYERIRTSKELSSETKVRLTKNHIGRIHKLYVNNIMTYAPGVFVGPKNESELSDQKAAELSNSIWQDAKEKLSYEDWISNWADDFCGISEVWTKCWFDPNGGPLKAYGQLLDESGQPVIDPETGAPAPDKNNPIFAGEIKFEEVYGFNLFRDPCAKSLRDSTWLMIRKMVPIKTLRKTFPGEDKQKMIAETSDKTFLVFDNAQGGYRKSDPNECLVREWYFRPSLEYPEGYYFITTETGVLDEGPLPFGIFPLEGEVFDKIQTSPRGRGIIKQIRPYQIEVNRCASKIAEHQMTLGDDKLIMFNGSKMSAGGQVPGVRGITVNGGQSPTILPGRNGNQFLEYMQSQIDEMYRVAMISEDSEANPTNGQLDPYALLFKSASQKKVFKRHIKRFESFLIRVTKLYLTMAKKYLPDDAVVMAVGKKERINIPEFKNSNDLSTEIVIEARTDDVETLMGKQLVMNHLLQYTGTQLSREDIGKIIKQMPYANVDESFSDLTINFEIATNTILALDRGERPDVSPNADHAYLVSKLDHRMMQSDFKDLHPFIQQNYVMLRDFCLGKLNEIKQQNLREQAGLIPTTGALIDAGAWIPDPEDPAKTKRLRLPQDSVYWLFQKLQDQGFMQAEFNKMTPELNYLRQTQNYMGQNGQPMGPPIPPTGMPQG